MVEVSKEASLLLQALFYTLDRKGDSSRWETA